METMEAGRHEERRAVDRFLEGEGRVRVLVALHAGEDHAENDRQDQADLQAPTVVLQQRVMGPGDRRARGQQDQRVEQREMPGIEDLDALGRPMSAREFDARVFDRLAGEQARIEEGPEPRHEEHHLGGDEQDHAVTMRQLHDAGVETFVLRLAHDIRPPGNHRVEDAQHAGAEHVGARLQTADGEALHPHDRADRREEGGDRSNERPRARRDEVIVVVRFGVDVGHRCPCHRDASRRPLRVTQLARR